MPIADLLPELCLLFGAVAIVLASAFLPQPRLGGMALLALLVGGCVAGGALIYYAGWLRHVPARLTAWLAPTEASALATLSRHCRNCFPTSPAPTSWRSAFHSTCPATCTASPNGVDTTVACANPKRRASKRPSGPRSDRIG